MISLCSAFYSRCCRVALTERQLDIPSRVTAIQAAEPRDRDILLEGLNIESRLHLSSQDDPRLSAGTRDQETRGKDERKLTDCWRDRISRRWGTPLSCRRAVSASLWGRFEGSRTARPSAAGNRPTAGGPGPFINCDSGEAGSSPVCAANSPTAYPPFASSSKRVDVG